MTRIVLASMHEFPPYSRGGGELYAAELIHELNSSDFLEAAVIACPPGVTQETHYHYGGIPVCRAPRAMFNDLVSEAVNSPEVGIMLSYLEGVATVAHLAHAKQTRCGTILVDRNGVFEGLCAFPEPPTIIVAMSRYLSELAKQHFGYSAIHLPPRLEIPVCGRSLAPEERRRKQVVGFVNPNLIKGGLLLLRVAEACPEVQFLATRGWTYTDSAPLVECDAENVELIDWNADVEPFYRRISLLLVPSLCPEGYGRVAREAALRGIPIVASNRGALRESACDAAVYLDPTDLGAWIKAVQELLCDSFAYAQLSANGMASAVAANKHEQAAALGALGAVVEAIL
ncbi:MAG: glycosyltransferase family 4 protein [Planctomycetes bacterium]|nr:glycosyltransferase family 4 protein [Planctomycetota bacterium]